MSGDFIVPPRPGVAWTAGATWLAFAVAAAVALWLWSTDPAAAAIAVAAILLVTWIAWRDLRTYTIPDAALAGLAVLAALDMMRGPLFRFEPLLATGAFVVEGLVCGGALFVVRDVYFRRRGHDGIGFGDVKLAAVGGLLCGLLGFSVALLAASLGGLLVALAARRLELGEWSRRIPFGAILAPALLVAWLVGA